MRRLIRLFVEQGQSAWLDNLTRPYLRDGTLARYVADGIRGVTANPTIVATAIEASDAYDDQIRALIASGTSLENMYWDLAVTDVIDALKVLRPTFDSSDGGDGFVSIEVSPGLARDTDGTVAAARELHERISEPNLLVKIPATPEGVPAIQAMTAEGRNINVTLIFSLERYSQVLEAHLSGLEQLAQRGGDVSTVRSVASFFVSRVDTEVDDRLEKLGTDEALALRGQAAVAQAKLAYRLFQEAHASERWARLVRLGARVQRPLWASTSTKNPDIPDTLYVDNLIGPHTINTLAERTLEAFEDHGTLDRTVDREVATATGHMRALAAVGVDMSDVGRALEEQGVAKFQNSLTHVMTTLAKKTQTT